MTDTVQVSLITGLAMVVSGAIATGGVILNGIITRRSILASRALSRREHAATAEKVVQAEAKVDQVHELVNDKMTELVKATQAEWREIGIKEGRLAALEELAGRVAESERVEDRAKERASLK